MSAKIGYAFENMVRKALKQLKESHGVFFHRFSDSKTAGSFAPNQPADFLVAYKGITQLWECKASEVELSLSSCLAGMVSDGQAGFHREWLDAGREGVFLFYAEPLGIVEVWPSWKVVMHRAIGTKLLGKPDLELPIDGLADRLLEVFK